MIADTKDISREWHDSSVVYASAAAGLIDSTITTGRGGRKPHISHHCSMAVILVSQVTAHSSLVGMRAASPMTSDVQQSYLQPTAAGV
jgi:hypothetical protein